MHRVDPVEIERRNAIHNPTDGSFVGEDSNLPVDLAHRARQVFCDYRRLITGLKEKVGRDETSGRLFDDHHRVPMMHMWRLEKPQRVASESQGLSVLETAHTICDAEPARV